MTFVRRLLIAASFGVLFLLTMKPTGTYVHAQAQVANPQTTTLPEGQVNPPPAYELSPDKLAKAIAISRIRHIMDIVNGLWGIAVLWVLLATGWLAALENWVKSLTQRRWLQGVIFFTLFIVITSLASLPLDWFSQSKEKSYNVAVQTWEAGWAIKRSRWDWRSQSPFRSCCCSTGL